MQEINSKYGRIFDWTDKSDFPDWDTFLKAELDQVQHILGEKAKEYTIVYIKNRLFNFEINARRQNISTSKMVQLLADKNLLGTMIVVNDTFDGRFTPQAMIDEKFRDTINYFILMKYAVEYDLYLTKNQLEWW